MGDAVSKLLLVKRKNKQANYFEEVFDVSNNLICVLDKNFIIKEVNPSFEEVLSVDKNNCLGLSLFTILKVDAIKESLSTITHNKEAIEIQSTTDGPNGNIIIEWYFNFNSLNQEIFAFGRNVTLELEKRARLESSERRFRNFFENAIGLMAIHNMDGEIVAVNEKGRQSLGYDKEDVLGLNLRDLIVSNQTNDLDAYLSRIVEHGEDSGIMVLRSKDGSHKYWLYNNILELDVDGNPFVMSTAFNMTERIQLERDLLHTKQILEQTNDVAQVGGWELNFVQSRVFGLNLQRIFMGLIKITSRL